MPTRKLIRITKFLLAGVTVFCVSWMASVNQWHARVRWVDNRGNTRNAEGLSTMRTIVAYSEGKQAEMDRPSPITCDRLPVYPKIPHFNRTWASHTYTDSWQKVKGAPVSLYSAYYDARTSQRFVRILAFFHGRNISSVEPLFCQTRALKSNVQSVEVVAAKPSEMWWHKWDPTSHKVETPLLLSCPLRDGLYDATVVSVVIEPCDDPKNAFVLKPFTDISKYTRTFTICVKDMYFKKNIVESLVEWIEANKILGVKLIDVYIDEISEETKNVLLNYKQQGYIRLFHAPVKYSLNRSLWQRRRDHLITYNDCLYRNLAESEYIIPLDVDEILLPKVAFNLSDLLTRLRAYGWNPNEFSAILVQNVFFFDFMQRVHNNKLIRNNLNRTEIYNKRDDVRIKSAMDPNLDKVQLDYDPNSKENFTYQKYNCLEERPIPKLTKHIIRSAIVSPVGYYSKSMMLTRRVLTAFNHYPLANIGSAGFAGWSAPFSEVQLNHYKDACNATMVPECEKYGQSARVDRTAVRLHPRLTHALYTALCQQIKIL